MRFRGRCAETAHASAPTPQKRAGPGRSCSAVHCCTVPHCTALHPSQARLQPGNSRGCCLPPSSESPRATLRYGRQHVYCRCGKQDGRHGQDPRVAWRICAHPIYLSIRLSTARFYCYRPSTHTPWCSTANRPGRDRPDGNRILHCTALHTGRKGKIPARIKK
ncbi:uncharacterized protein DI49_1494 [Saccharomyces eubayanus]|uniref:uncharacterized protein n=1 Tax=Saccharomyces eubayanus TaxID=1080349 RepID=UPI0006C30E03|nr:hypothetical protein DI49_1494 [Saccharomyces eubayanus]KOH00040.1 hypothetical protein DI49_1494 [Saccharomyces eubayanus]